MQKTWNGLCWLSLLMLGLAGCWTTEPNLRPPKQPEELRKPPEDDLRFSAPQTYPKNTLNQDTIKRYDDLSNQPGPMRGPGGSSRMGGPGGY